MVSFISNLFRPRSREEEFGRAAYEFFRAAHARGASMSEARIELAIRTAMIRIRRKVSARTVLQPDRYSDFLHDATLAEMRLLEQSHGRDAASALYRVIAESPVTDILYDDAERALDEHRDRQTAAWLSTPIDSDLLAALR